MKNFTKKMLCLLLVVFLAMPMGVYAAGGTFNISPSKYTVAPGETFTVTIGGACTGRVDVSVSNGTTATSMTWVEIPWGAREGYTSFQVTAGTSGSVTVTATPFEGFSDPDAELFEPGSKSVTVKIEKPASGDNTGGNQGGGSTGGSTSGGSSSGGSSSSGSSSGGSSSGGSSSGNSGAVAGDNDLTQAEKDKDSNKDTDDSKDKDKDKDKTPVKDDEKKPDADTNKDKDKDSKKDHGCLVHWAIIITAIGAAIIEFLMKGRKNESLIVIAIFAVEAIVLALIGSCDMDWIFAIAGIIVVACEFLILREKAAKDNK